MMNRSVQLLATTVKQSSLSNVRFFASINQDHFGNPLSVLRYNGKTADIPLPSSDEIQVKVSAAVVTPEDVFMIRGESHNLNSTDFAGMTSVGKVIHVGANVGGTKVGDQVLLFHNGAWTDHLNVKSSRSVTVSDSISSSVAATFPIHLSAWAIIQHFNKLKHGDTVLQASASTPVGKAVSALSKELGYNVLEPTEEELLSQTFTKSNRGKHKFIVSGLGGKLGGAAIKSLGQNGKMISFRGKYSSLMETGTIDVPVSSAIFRDAVVEGFDFVTWVKNHPEQVVQGLQRIEKLALEKKLPISPELFQLKDYQKAIKKVAEENSVTVLQW